MTNPHCIQCETGFLQMNNHYALKKDKNITRMEFIRRGQKLGAICFACIYNEKSKKRAKKIQKLFPNFKSLDMFVAIIKSKINCPLCGYIVGEITDGGFLYEYCISDGCKFRQKTEVVNAKQ